MAVNFLIGVILARLLLPSEFGLVALIMVNVIIAEVLFELGLGASLIQRDNVSSSHYSSVFVINVSLGLIISVLVFVFAGAFSDFYRAPALEELVQVLSVVFFLSALTSIHKIYLRRELKQMELSRANLIAIVVGGVVGISMAWKGAGVWSLVAQKVAYFLSSYICCSYSSNLRPSFKFSKQAFIELWGFSYKVFLSRLIDVLFRRADIIVAGRLFDLNTVGFYQRARSLNDMSTRAVSLSILSVMMPVFSRVSAEPTRFRSLVVSSHAMVCLVSFLLFGALYVSTFELIEIIYTAKWLQSASYFQILCLSAVAFPMNSLLASAVEGSGNGNWMLKMVVFKRSIYSAVLIVGFSLGIEYFLYGLVLVGITNTLISAYAVSSLGGGKAYLFVRNIVNHASAAAAGVFISLSLESQFSFSTLSSAVFKCGVYAALYLSICHLFKFQSLQGVYKQVVLVSQKR